MASFSSLRSDIFSRERRRQHYESNIMGLNAYDRHKKFMDDYVNHYRSVKAPSISKFVKTDMDTLRESYRFIRTEEDDMDGTWEQRLAKRYYDKLFKEYCIADMSRYKESKIGLRWRFEKEVVSGKGQFICGNKKCNEKEGLRSYEARVPDLLKVNFAYTESGENRQALVKLRVCPRCAYKLNYRKEKELERQLVKEQRRLRRRRSESESRRRQKRSLKANNGSDHEEQSNSKNPNSDTSEEKQHVETGRSQGSRDPSPGPSTKSISQVQPSQGNPKNEEFEHFFEGMFL